MFFSALEGGYFKAAGKTPQKGFFMKNRMKLTVIIALVAIFGLLIASCGKLDTALDNTWKNEKEEAIKIKIASDGITFTFGDYAPGATTGKQGDKVITKNDELIVNKGNDEIGKTKYKIDGDKLTIDKGSGIFEILGIIEIAYGKVYKK